MGAACVPQLFGELGLRLNKNAGPAGLFQMPGLRAVLGLVRADLYKKPLTARSEEFADQARLLLEWEDGAHDLLPFDNQRFMDARERATISLVEYPGTISTRMTSPPSASTVSRPTTWLRA